MIPFFTVLGRRGCLAKDNWFEECSHDQLKNLCKAANLAHTGNTQDMISRLISDTFVVQFGGNISGFNRCTVKYLKQKCRDRRLQVSGTKFELVLRIVQHEKGTGGNSLKRAATETVVVDGSEAHVAKKPKPSKPSAKSYYTQIKKKICAVTQKKYQTHWGSKSHAVEVCNLMEKLIVTTEKESDPRLVCECYNAIILSFVENYGAFERPGYCEELESMACSIGKHVAQIRTQVTKPRILDDLASTMLEFKEVGSSNGLLDGFDMEEVVQKIQGPVAKASPTNTATTDFSDFGTSNDLSASFDMENVASQIQDTVDSGFPTNTATAETLSDTGASNGWMASFEKEEVALHAQATPTEVSLTNTASMEGLALKD